MVDPDRCDDCGKLLNECSFWKEVERVLDDIESGKIKMIRQNADEFLTDMKRDLDAD
jgi:uncharacterized protein YihD (DUF1040 family)